MRFMLCARDGATGTMTLVSDRSFPTRREAILAISDARDVPGLADSDVFLVDLDAAVPVAVVPCAGGPAVAAPQAAPEEVPEETLEEAGAGAEAPVAEAAEQLTDDATAPEADAEAEALAEAALDLAETVEEVLTDSGMRLGFVEIDIEAWTCEDCIYTATCAKVGTIRPAECASFQWRA